MSRPKRLLITTQKVDKDDPILGFFHGWILEFSKHFERIDVICLQKGVYELPPHVRVHSLGKEEGKTRFTYLVRFYALFIRYYLLEPVDFVFYHMGAIYNILGAPFFAIRHLKGTQFYWWKTHGKVHSLKETFALRCIDRVYTAGSKSFDRKSDKVVIVGHAIDCNRFDIRSDIPRRTERCLVVGRIVPIKKIEVSLRACSHIVDVPSFELILVGSPDRPPYQKELEHMVEELGLSAKVHFIGSRTQLEIVSEYAQSGILLHPAYEAGFDKVVLEAMASGVIPITSIPSFKPILEPFGLYVAPEDDKGYANAIRRIMKLPVNEREALSRALRARVVENHSLKTISARIFKL